MRKQRSILALVAASGFVVLLAACGGSSKSADKTTTTTASAGGSAALCAARDSLSTDVKALTSVDAIKGGTDSIQAALTKVKDDVAALKTAAGDQLKPQVPALEDSLTKLTTAVGNLGSGGAAAFVTAAQEVGTAAQALFTSLQNTSCK
jgi:hypothetical protein